MAFFRSIKQNLVNLQEIFRKRKRSLSSSSRRDSCRDNSENNPVRNQPDSDQAPAQDISTVPNSSTVDQDVSRRRQGTSDVHGRTGTDRSVTPVLGEKSARGIPSPSSEALESDSEPEDKGVARCQCSRIPPFSPGSDFSEKLPKTFAEEIYGENDTCRRRGSAKDKSTPSTSRQPADLGAVSTTDTGHSSCSLEDQLMEEMVSTLKTRGSLGSRRRSRSRSRRSRPRQGYENGIVVSNVRVLHTVPRRETDSDESNTSLNDLPLAFFSSTTHHTSACHSNLQSDSSFHSVAGSDACTTPQGSSASTKMEEEEEGEARVDEEEWDGGGVNSTEHNRSRRDGAVSRQVEELASYGPEEFVLDLLLAMCRGTWSDIL